MGSGDKTAGTQEIMEVFTFSDVTDIIKLV